LVLRLRWQQDDAAVEIDGNNVKENRQAFAFLVAPDRADPGPELAAAAAFRHVVGHQFRRGGFTGLLGRLGTFLCHGPSPLLGLLDTPSSGSAVETTRNQTTWRGITRPPAAQRGRVGDTAATP